MCVNKHNVPACVCECRTSGRSESFGECRCLTSSVLRFPPTVTDQLPFWTSGGHISAAAAAAALALRFDSSCQLPSNRRACLARVRSRTRFSNRTSSKARSTDKLRHWPRYEPRVISRDVIRNDRIRVKPANFCLGNQDCVTSQRDTNTSFGLVATIHSTYGFILLTHSPCFLSLKKENNITLALAGS